MGLIKVRKKNLAENSCGETISPSKVWRQYREGITFKSGIGFYDTVDKNERFFAGDQWAGVNAPDLPKPVVNFIKRICQQRVSEVLANPVSVNFEPVDFPGSVAGLKKEPLPVTDREAELLNAVFDADWNRMKMDSLNLEGLVDASVTGDCILYTYWNSRAETGQAARGQICAQTLDNVNFYPGNPNERDVQKQPYLIIARREMLADVIAQAQENGCPQSEIELIAADSDCFEQSGDMGKRELEGSENAKCITLLYLFKNEDGLIFAQKTTRSAVVRPVWNTLLSRYPLALMNWEYRKNCCFGRAEVTGLIPVQRYINQMYAMAMLFTMQSACPKAVFNQGMVKAWSNAVGTAIPVNGDITAAVKYLEPPKLPSDIYDLPKRLMDTTLQLTGVSEIDLGSVTPNNTSATVLAREASSMPVNSIRTRFYAMIEDFALNWLDMAAAYASVPRWLKISGESGPKTAVFDPSKLRGRLFSVKVDVGAATAWSEINSVQMLKTLFDAGIIDARQYVERLPTGYLPMRGKLLSQMSVKEPAKKITEKEKTCHGK